MLEKTSLGRVSSSLFLLHSPRSVLAEKLVGFFTSPLALVGNRITFRLGSEVYVVRVLRHRSGKNSTRTRNEQKL